MQFDTFLNIIPHNDTRKYMTGGFNRYQCNSEYWHQWSVFQSVALVFGRLTGNDISGHSFQHYYYFPPPTKFRISLFYGLKDLGHQNYWDLFDYFYSRMIIDPTQ